MEISGNPPPSFKILNAFIDPQLATILDDSGFELGADRGELVTLIRAREEAQAALAEAAAAARASEAEDTTLGIPATPVSSDSPSLLVLSEGAAATREIAAAPTTSRAPAKKRVAKPVTSRGVRLRNRII